MALSGWSSILGGQSGQTVSDHLDSAFANIDTEIDNISSAGGILERLTASEVDIVALEAAQPFIHTFDYDKTANFTVTNDVYEEVARLTTISRATGTYMLGMSMIYALNSTTTSAYFRFSLDGGSTWLEVPREPKDNTDLMTMTYDSVIVHTVGVFEIIVQARKENAADTLVISALDLMFERKA